MAEEAYIAHRLPGRVRLRMPRRKADGPFLRELAASLRALSGVSEVRVTPSTASVLICHEGEFEALAARAESEGLFALASAPSAAGSPLQTVSQELVDLDGRLRGVTEGRWGLGSLAFYGLLGGAVVQVARGHYMPAATSMVYHAMKVLGEVVEYERQRGL